MMRKLLYSFLFPIYKSLLKRLCTPNLILLCIGMFFVVNFASAAEYYTISDGAWTNRNTWSTTSGGNRVGNNVFPKIGDIVHIERGFTVTLTANAECASIDFSTTNTDNSIVLGNNTLNVSGNISIPRSGSNLNWINVGAGTLNAGSIDFPTTGSAVRHKITISTGTVKVSGNVSTSSVSATSATIEFTGAGLLQVGGDLFSNGGGSLTPSTGTVQLNGVNQSFKAFNFYNLTFSGSGTKSFTGTTSVTNSLVINSGIKADLGTQTHTANSLTMGGTQATPSSWGSSNSSAQNKNDVFFTATTGQINVSSSACTTFSSVTAITNVLFGSINNSTSASSTASYIYYSSVPAASVSKGQYYELTVKGYTNGGVNSYYTAYFDWNGDGDFADAGEGPYKIGTINSSSGTDSKATSVYLQIPPGSGSTAGSTKMRVIARRNSGYNNDPCAISGSTGQIQDYNIAILEPCVGNAPGNTLTTASSVCPNAPFTLSLQNKMADGTSYVWQTSPDGNAPWTDATAAPTTFFSNTFSVNQAANTTVGDISLYGNDTSISGGALFLTTLNTGYTGGFVIQKTPGTNINTFSASFDYKIYGGNGADGISLSYASNIGNNVGGGEGGEGSGIVLQLDTYDNEGVQTGSRVRITYNGNSIFNSAIDAPINLRTNSTTFNNVVMNVDDRGYLTLTVAGNVIVSNLALPAAYLSSDKSNWKFKFSGRTGASNDYHIIDNVNIYYLDTTNSKATFTTTQTKKTYYRVAATCGGTTVTSSSVMVDMTSATINAKTVSACSGTAFNVTLVNGTDGTIPNGTTYTWTAPSVTGGLTGGAASTGTPSTITGTLTNTTATAQTATYTVTPVTGSCTGVPFTLTVTVNPSPTLTGVTQLASFCSGSAATINLGGLLASSTSTITYTIDGTPQTPITSVVANAGGTASFTTPVLTSANNGKTLQITGIIVTSATPNCSSTSTRSVILAVNPTPTLTNATQSAAVCTGSAATINLTGLLAGSTSTITYTIDGAAQTPITSVVATGTGTASFTTPALTSANNGKILRITGVTTTSSTPNCNSTFAIDVILAVNPTSTLTGAFQPLSVCTGSVATINLTGLLANSTSTISYSINSVAQTPITSVVATAGGTASFTTRALTSADNLQTLQITQITTTSSTPNCSTSFTTNVTLSVNPLPTLTAVKDKDFTCESGGTVIISNLPASWTINQTGQAPQTITGTTSSRTITGLAAGNYNFTVTNNATTCTSNVAAITINNQTSSTTWNGSGWSNGLPDGNKSIIIAVATSVAATQPFTTATPDIYGCSLTVNSGAVVTIPSDVTLHITNIVATNGQLIFETNSSLLQTTNAVNTGNIVYKRATSVRRMDLTYWSSPVTKAGGFTMHDFSPTTLGDKYFYFNPSSGWTTNMNGTMAVETGIGYSIRGPQEFDTVTPSVFTGTFTGVPNNGDITITGIPNNGVVTMPIIIDKFFLFGNPYPSAIDAEELLDANKDVLGPLYFWTHATAPARPVGDNTYRYTSNDYTVFTLAGSTDITGLSSRPFAGKIAAGQGFIAKPKSTQIHFNNGMRVGGTNNGEFFKTAKTTSLEKNRIWLNIKNA